MIAFRNAERSPPGRGAAASFPATFRGPSRTRRSFRIASEIRGARTHARRIRPRRPGPAPDPPRADPGTRPAPGPRNPLRHRRPHPRAGRGARVPGADHHTGADRPLLRGTPRGGARAHAPDPLRHELGGTPAGGDGHRLGRADREPGRDPVGPGPPGRPSRAVRRRRRSAGGGAAGGDDDPPRHPRQRDQLERRGDGRGLPPAGGPGRRRRGPRPAREPGPHRSDGEPGRTQPLRLPEQDRGGPLAGRRHVVGRARRAVAGRARQPLPLRPQPRPLHPEPAGDAGKGGGDAGVPSADRGGPPRDERQLHVLLPPHGPSGRTPGSRSGRSS